MTLTLTGVFATLGLLTGTTVAIYHPVRDPSGIYTVGTPALAA